MSGASGVPRLHHSTAVFADWPWLYAGSGWKGDDMGIRYSHRHAGLSEDIQQMASGSQQIVSSVREIDRLSKNAAGESQTVSAATEEQSASMEEIASSSQSLAHLAQDLQEAVSKFRV